MSDLQEKILIVNDSALERSQMRDLLIKNGYPSVWECKGGIEAVMKYKLLNPELLIIYISDLMDVEVIKSILQKNPTGKILVIGFEGSESYVGEAMRVGAKEYLIGPYTEEVFLTIINGMMR